MLLILHLLAFVAGPHSDWNAAREAVPMRTPTTLSAELLCAVCPLALLFVRRERFMTIEHES
jgi:hypothetical protein